MIADELDLDAVTACADLCARSGATDFEVGYLEDDVPLEKARWYAQTSYRGARIFVDEKASPDEACDALARRILAGGQCTRCGRKVAINKGGPPNRCNWYRDGPSWVRGCDGKRLATKVYEA